MKERGSGQYLKSVVKRSLGLDAKANIYNAWQIDNKPSMRVAKATAIGMTAATEIALPATSRLLNKDEMAKIDPGITEFNGRVLVDVLAMLAICKLPIHELIPAKLAVNGVTHIGFDALKYVRERSKNLFTRKTKI